MKKWGKFIGFIVLALIELIFYFDMKEKDMDFFFLVWSFVWLAFAIYGFISIFQKGKSSSIGNPMGHPRDFLMHSGVKVNNPPKAANTIGMIALLLLLFAINVVGYIVFM